MKLVSRTLVLAAALALGFSATSIAQDVPGAARWEVSAFPGGGIFFTEGDTGSSPDFGEYGLGGAFTFNVNRWIGVEGEIGAGLSIDQNLSFGSTTLSNAKVPHSLAYNGSVIYSVTGNDRPFAPYVAGGLGGLTFFTRDDVQSLGLNNDETFLAGNVGGGVKWFLSPHWGVRGDYRFFVVDGKDDVPAFFGLNETRYGHRVYGGFVFTGGR
jgi:opacity protein-like surface antigen